MMIVMTNSYKDERVLRAIANDYEFGDPNKEWEFISNGLPSFERGQGVLVTSDIDKELLSKILVGLDKYVTNSYPMSVVEEELGYVCVNKEHKENEIECHCGMRDCDIVDVGKFNYRGLVQVIVVT